MKKPSAIPSSLAERAQSRDAEVLTGVAADPGITEELALSLLTRRDFPAPAIEALAHNLGLLKHRKVMVGIVSHPRTPRHVSLPSVRQMYTFDLVKVAMLPAVPTDVKVAIDETIVARLEQISEGERLTLAKQASGRVATALLLDPQKRVATAAMDNPRMTEAGIVKALGDRDSTQHLVDAVCRHTKWFLRRDIRLALLRNEHLSLAQAIACAAHLPPPLLREVLSKSKMKPEIKEYLLGALPEK